MKTKIIVTLQVEGAHFWPGCDIDEVDFLRHPHRHMFYVRAEKKVSHDDRDIEIIQFKRKIREYLYNKYYNPTLGYVGFGPKSCEMLATEIMEQF